MPRTCGLVGFLLLAIVGCGSESGRAEPVPMDKVPPALVKVATEAAPGIKFERAFKIKVGNETAYEIKGKDKRGKIREVEVSEAGKVLEIE